MREFIRRGLEAVPDGTGVCFLTVTEGSSFRSVPEHARAVSGFLRDLFRWQDRIAGVKRTRPYAGVREFQGRGAVHTHLLIVGWSFVPKWKLREVDAMAARWGLGRTSVRGSFLAGKANRNGSGEEIRNLAAYLSKTFGGYLAKGFDDYDTWRELMPPGYRQVIHGGGWADGLTLEGVRADRLGKARQRHGDKAAPSWSEQDALDLLGRALDVQVLDVIDVSPNLSG